MTAPGLPPGPNKNRPRDEPSHVTRPAGPASRQSPRARRPFASSHLHLLTSRPGSRAPHHTPSAPASAPPSLSLLFSLPTLGRERRAGLRMPADSCAARPRPRPTPALAGVTTSPRHGAQRPPDRQTDPQSRRGGRGQIDQESATCLVYRVKERFKKISPVVCDNMFDKKNDGED